MRSFPTEVSITIAAPRPAVFEYIVPIDLPSIFTGYGPLPAVTGTRDQTGGWDAAGQTRSVDLSDGSSAHERLTQYQFPRTFSYRVSDFSGVLRFLVESADGQWWFESEPPATGTLVRWRYAFHSRSWLAAPVVWFITTVLWRGYMQKALRLSKAQIEARAP